jgi:hypothetical protein
VKVYRPEPFVVVEPEPVPESVTLTPESPASPASRAPFPLTSLDTVPETVAVAGAETVTPFVSAKVVLGFAPHVLLLLYAMK